MPCTTATTAPTTRAVPPNPPPHMHPPDAVPSPSAALHSALRLPRASEKVASWLFPTDSESPFVHSSTLPPSLFDRSLTLVSESYFTPSNDAPPSVAAALPKETYFLVLIPLHTDDSITLGFTFHIGLPAADSLFPIADVLPSKFALAGRFAYEKLAHQMLIFIKHFTHNYSHLGVCERTPSYGRKLQFVSLPKKPFSATQLPSEAVGVTVLSQALDEPADGDERMNEECINDDESSGRSSNGKACPSGRRENPLTIRQEQASTVVASRTRGGRGGGGRRARVERHGNMQEGGSDEGCVGRSVAELGAFMCGEFRECPITLDMPSTPDRSQPEVVGVYKAFTRHAEGKEAEMLRKMAARTYYASAGVAKEREVDED